MSARIHALAETAAAYASSPAARHVKLSITLPEDLVGEIRAAAGDSGLGVSGVIAAAVRQALSLDGDRLEAAGQALDLSRFARIRLVGPNGKIRSIVGPGINYTPGQSGPIHTSPGIQPTSVTLDEEGNLYFTDRGDCTLKKAYGPF